jgi:predicted nucleotidyltransferase
VHHGKIDRQCPLGVKSDQFRVFARRPLFSRKRPGRLTAPGETSRERRSPPGANLALMKLAEANAIITAVRSWAIKRDDIRAMALVGSWARGDQGQVSDIDLLLLSDRVDEYRHSQKWVTEIDLRGSGYRLISSESAIYGAVWSRHVRLLPAAEIELAFAECSWAQTEPVDDGTRGVVKDAFRIIFDKDRMLSKLVAAVAPG